LLVLSALLVFPGTLLGQLGFGTITGTVTDTTGSAIPGVNLKLSNLATGVVLQTQTSSSGIYNFGSLNPGAYRVEAVKSGFKTSIIQTLSISADQPVTADIHLQVGETQTRVDVSATPALLNESTQSVATTLENKIVAEIPYPERSSLGAITLIAGVVGDPGLIGGVATENPAYNTSNVVPGAQITIGGAWQGRSPVLIDGADVTQASFPREGISISSEMIQETTVITNGIPAQYGLTEGGLVIQATKAGTNTYHAAVTVRHSDPGLNAFPLGGTIKSALHENFFGGYFSGPVWLPKIYHGKNRTFFLVGVEPGRVSNKTSGFAQVPTPQELSGDFSNSISLINTTILTNQGAAAALAAPRVGALYYQTNLNSNGLPTGPIYASTAQYVPIPNDNVSAQLARNPFAQYVVSQLPTPTNPGLFTYLNPQGLWNNAGYNAYYLRGINNIDNRYAFRVDHQFTENDRLFVRYSNEPITANRFYSFPISNPLDAVPSDKSYAQDVAMNETHVINSSMVNELRLMYMRNFQIRAETGAAVTEDWGASLGLPAATIGVGFPRVSFGYSFNGIGAANSPNKEVDENYQFSDDLSWTKGQHSLRFGIDVRHIESNQVDLAGVYGGNYTFAASSTANGSAGGNALASMDLGLISSYSATPTEVPAYYRWRYYAGFAQDDYKILPNLTLNIGVRYEFETPQIEKYNNQGTFLPNITGTLNGQSVTGAFCFSGACGLSNSIFPANHLGFQPRIGLAWHPLNKMTFRASYGINRVPLTGYNRTPDPDFNVSSATVGGVNGGAVAGAAVDYLTNPVTTLTSALAALQGSRGPFFTVQGVTIPYVVQNNVVPYAQQWDAVIQYEATRNSLIQISYQGLRGVHLISNYAVPLNAPSFSTLVTDINNGYNFSQNISNPLGIAVNGAVVSETRLQALNPYPNFFNQTLAQYLNRQGDSIYNALYLTYTYRYQFGLSLTASYSWSKSIDDVGGDNNLQNSNSVQPAPVQFTNNLALERAVSSWDVPSRFTTGYSYELPIGHGRRFSTHLRWLDEAIGNWTTAGTLQSQSGMPFSPELGSSGYFVSTSNGVSALPSGYTLRPNIVPGQSCINPDWRANAPNSPYINDAYFSVPGSLGAPAFGDAPRTLTGCRGPMSTIMNMNLKRRIPINKSETHYLEIGAEAFNALNHSLFLMPNTNYNAFNAFNSAAITNKTAVPFTYQTSFGFVSAQGALSRTLQLTAKLSW
jgi:hypothetical protein